MRFPSLEASVSFLSSLIVRRNFGDLYHGVERGTEGPVIKFGIHEIHENYWEGYTLLQLKAMIPKPGYPYSCDWVKAQINLKENELWLSEGVTLEHAAELFYTGYNPKAEEASCAD